MKHAPIRTPSPQGFIASLREPGYQALPDPWLCVPASRLVCHYRRRVRDKLFFETKATEVPNHYRKFHHAKRSLVAIAGRALDFRNTSSKSARIVVPNLVQTAHKLSGTSRSSIACVWSLVSGKNNYVPTKSGKKHFYPHNSFALAPYSKLGSIEALT